MAQLSTFSRSSSQSVSAIPELLDFVFEHLHKNSDKDALSSASQTCRLWCNIASSYPFRSIGVRALDSCHPFHHFQAFLDSFPGTDGRNQFIRELELEGEVQGGHPKFLAEGSDPEYHQAGFSDSDRFTTPISTAFIFHLLTRLPNLQVLNLLCLDIYYRKVPECIPYVGHGWRSALRSRLPTLVELKIDVEIGENTQSLLDLLGMFLDIQNLYIEGLGWSEQGSESPCEVIANKLPPRLKLKTLYIDYMTTVPGYVLQGFGRTQSVNSLQSITVKWDHEGILAGLGKLLCVAGPSLRHLQLHAACLTEFAELDETYLNKCTSLASFKFSLPLDAASVHGPSSLSYIVNLLSKLSDSVCRIFINLRNGSESTVGRDVLERAELDAMDQEIRRLHNLKELRVIAKYTNWPLSGGVLLSYCRRSGLSNGLRL